MVLEVVIVSGLIPLRGRSGFKCSRANLCPRKWELCELKNLFIRVITMEH
jgi:hypothetical protein